MDPTLWLAMPSQVDDQIRRWQSDPDTARLLDVTTIQQYTGERVHALSVTDPDVPREEKLALWLCVPHAHEPAGTAACLDVAQQLLTGRNLRGLPVDVDVRALRRRLIVTLNPDANPGGRCWSPVLWWDGSRYSNEELWQWMRGVDPETGGMWRRLARWSRRETSPLRRGIVYEQLNEHEFVEPNRNPNSSLVRLFQQMDRRYRYDRSLHLHQTEFESSDRNCMVNLPVLFPELSGPVREANLRWAGELIEAWTALGASVARPVSEPREFPYYDDLQTVEWFRACWGEIERRAPELIVEIQNNSPRTTPEQQLLLMETAIWRTVEKALA